jgi:hypothetical protein
MTEYEIIKEAVSLGRVLGVENWVELKKVLLVTLSPQDRSNFSTRDPKTKKQRLNKFEANLIDNYWIQTGVRLNEPEKEGFVVP